MRSTLKYFCGRFFAVSAILGSMLVSSCIKEYEPSGQEMENRSFRAWMKKNRPELLGNYQSDGEYYVEVESWGDTSTPAEENDFGGEPIMDQDTCWMFYNMTGFDLDGNVCINRSEMTARMQGTFSLYTHYVPYLNFCGKTNLYSILEGTYLAARNTVTLSDEYVSDNWSGYGNEFKLRRGSKVRLYMPSTIAYGSSGTSAEGGYEGQYKLDANVPMIMEIEVMRTIKNPSDREVEMVEALVDANNIDFNRDVWIQAKEEKSDEGTNEEETGDGSEEEDDGTLTGLYYNLYYEPGEHAVNLRYMQPHLDGLDNPYKDSGKYADMAELDKEINRILAEKFEGKVLAKEDMSEENLIGDKTANVWYLVRFLDGFVLDTNISEIKELVFDDAGSSNSAISYNSETNRTEYCIAWYHCIPKMHFGQWAAILTTSGYAYGSDGITGSTEYSSSSSIYNYDYLSYMNFYNYNNAYYFNDFYYDYGNYGLGNYYVPGSSNNMDVSSIYTEVLPYTPLVFYVYIEPAK